MSRPGEELVFAPLGGVGEIGMNLSLYGIGTERSKKWLAVDLGVSFAQEEHLPGVDLILPDIRYLEGERKNLLGIVITHGHEDHIGALLDLWPRLKAPVYATPFAAALIETKRARDAAGLEMKINVVPVGGRFTLGDFDIEMIPVAHSIPESHAIALRTRLGNVLHTGDWKIDPTPVVGLPTDEARMRAFGAEGVRAIVGDSTNAVREGRSPSEAQVAETLTQLVSEAKGRVAVTTFASQVARIRSVALAAQACGREVVLVGRAMERVAQIARELGYLEGVPDFRSQDAYGYLPPDKVVALCTGSQGETRAAIARIAKDEHPAVTLNKGDCVIFSSRTIPGNEKEVGAVINGLIEQGIEVITDRTHLVHVSGHPRLAEMEDLYGWIKPEVSVPVHGEPLHLHEHARLARRLGVKEIVTCRNGEVVRLAPGPSSVVDELPAGRLYKDGNLIIEAAARTVQERRRMMFAGLIAISLAITEKGEMAADPEVEFRGIPEVDASGRAMLDIAMDAMMDTFDNLPRARRRDPDAVEESISRAVRAMVAQAWGKKPNMLVHVLVV
ncbi:putative ribonuclease J [Variibacter gotjawalensis]|uniref:Putative ribonuclease J n=1 Tax=Variibacter gotjawalensis TaxID=1333996 RepID=A0A0S3PWD6_9BRAD|nr:ribonuclease J [Variibacter gotjawalensis]NIK46067.1 ribonuclease J [Variibacter gotjawalensis]RZS47985.1 ribonuclease J [Variibacter gotjawalensis]BAT60241.1 putative ribonuclease J [Variibacter gotjawalensis]